MTRLITFRQVFCASKDQKEIYYQFEKMNPEVNSESDAHCQTQQTRFPHSGGCCASLITLLFHPHTTIAGPAASMRGCPNLRHRHPCRDRLQNLKKQLSGSPTVQSRSRNSPTARVDTFRTRSWVTSQGEFFEICTRQGVRGSFRWRFTVLPSDLVTLAISANI